MSLVSHNTYGSSLTRKKVKISSEKNILLRTNEPKLSVRAYAPVTPHRCGARNGLETKTSVDILQLISKEHVNNHSHALMKLNPHIDLQCALSCHKDMKI